MAHFEVMSLLLRVRGHSLGSSPRGGGGATRKISDVYVNGGTRVPGDKGDFLNGYKDLFFG